ncbi:UVR8, partial [Symbiodinium pilosum]
LGFGGRSRRWEARPVARLGPATDIRAGGSHTCALEVSGTVRCWGWGEFGQLGDGRTLDSLYPVRVAHIEHADAICSGALHSCAVEDGMVKCWGWGERGQLGMFNGTRRTENSAVPVVVEGLEDVTDVACGYQHSCAMHGSDDNQTTTCWGEGIDRQLQRHDEIWIKTARR